jgi:hypothetical protein
VRQRHPIDTGFSSSRPPTLSTSSSDDNRLVFRDRVSPRLLPSSLGSLVASHTVK